MHKRAFTLIELLIVVAIIAILAAIAVPNFLEAQTRAKISRVKAEFRSLATALYAYNSDQNHFPVAHGIGLEVGTFNFDISLWPLTTPIAYMSNISLRDPFNTTTNLAVTNAGDNGNTIRPLYHYFNYEAIQMAPPLGTYTRYSSGMDLPYSQRMDWMSGMLNGPLNQALVTGMSHRAFGLWSPGPNRNENGLFYAEFTISQSILANNGSPNPGDVAGAINAIYDPTNGTISKGDILRLGGDFRATMLPVDGVR